MKYEVLKDFRGAPEGHTVIEYRKGEIVEITGSLAEIALKKKWIRSVKQNCKS